MQGLKWERIAVMTNPLIRGHVKLGHLLPYLPATLVWALEAGTEKFPKALREKINLQMAACLPKPPAAATGVDRA
jgi:hypothetical protein